MIYLIFIVNLMECRWFHNNIRHIAYINSYSCQVFTYFLNDSMHKLNLRNIKLFQIKSEPILYKNKNKKSFSFFLNSAWKKNIHKINMADDEVRWVSWHRIQCYRNHSINIHFASFKFLFCSFHGIQYFKLIEYECFVYLQTK